MADLQSICSKELLTEEKKSHAVTKQVECAREDVTLRLSLLANGIRALAKGPKASFVPVARTNISKIGKNHDKNKSIVRCHVLMAIDMQDEKHTREQAIEDAESEIKQMDKYIEQLKEMIQASSRTSA